MGYVLIEAYGGDGNLKRDITVSEAEWESGQLSLIDDEDYRREMGIFKIVSTIYIGTANVISGRIVTSYDETGSLISTEEYNGELKMVKADKICYDKSKAVGFYVVAVKSCDTGLSVSIEMEFKNENAACKFEALLLEYQEDEESEEPSVLDKRAEMWRANSYNENFLEVSFNFDALSEKPYTVEVSFEVLENGAAADTFKVTALGVYAATAEIDETEE
ncbi:MAG: hypothetical protein LBS21_00325 [Clostridiales bacterium]|nr:hypothetical protein [Clostridiales bacterium]